MLISFYAAPRISPRFYPVVLRNLLVWRKLAVPSVVGNIAEPLITLVAFGYGLGSMIGRVDGLPYVSYLASGSIAVSSMRSSSRLCRPSVWGLLLTAMIRLLLSFDLRTIHKNKYL